MARSFHLRHARRAALASIDPRDTSVPGSSYTPVPPDGKAARAAEA
jgi:hypothetical protein